MEQNYGTYDKQDLISEFNEAKFQILRLHLLWSNCNSLSQAGRLTEWKWKLDTIWRELKADADRQDKNKYEKRIKLINLQISLAEKSKSPEKLYSALQDKEMFLRILADKVGKGGKTKPEGADEFEF